MAVKMLFPHWIHTLIEITLRLTRRSLFFLYNSPMAKAVNMCSYQWRLMWIIFSFCFLIARTAETNTPA